MTTVQKLKRKAKVSLIIAFTTFKVWLLRLNLFKLSKPLISPLSKSVHFSALSDWISKNRDLELNDFPAKKSFDYSKRYDLYNHIINTRIKDQPVNYLEFGVADGETFYWWLNTLKNEHSRFFGFDTFTGLPEDWGYFTKGSFSMEGNIPPVSDYRGKLIKGLFQDTLYDFLTSFQNNKKNLILMDADLYSSTLFALTSLAPFLKTGDIIMFDEFAAPRHEFLAYLNFAQSHSNIQMHPFAKMPAGTPMQEQLLLLHQYPNASFCCHE